MYNVGKVIYGFCNGFFGRDDYENKIIIAEGDNWIVCKYCDDLASYRVTFASFNNADQKQLFINAWMTDSN